MSSTWRGRTARLLRNAKTAFTGALMATALLSACGGGSGGSGTPTVATAPAVPTGLSVGYDVKAFKLSWVAVTPPAGGGAVTYRVTEDPDGAGPQAAVQVATDLTSSSHTQQVNGLLHTRLNATYTVQACNSAGCSALATPVMVDVKQAIGYFKASNTGYGANFGYSVALSADGTTLAVGGRGDSSSATGINGNQNNSAAGGSGAVYVFVRSGTVWSQQAYVKASNTTGGEAFGLCLTLSADGNTLAVGAPFERSNATGVNGDQTNQEVQNAGAVYVFTRSGTAWSQQAYVKASNTGIDDRFGRSVALSADGTTLAVGAFGEASITTGINGDQTNNAAESAGAVYVFTRSGITWNQQAYVKASNTHAPISTGKFGLIKVNDVFGYSVALSADGTTLAVGARSESSNATGINGDQTNIAAIGAGAVYVFTRSGTTWSQQAYIKADSTAANDEFGTGVALSANGETLAAGGRGGTYVFIRSAGVWSQQSSLGRVGGEVALSADGATLAVGNSGGAAYVFARSGTNWSQQASIEGRNTEVGDGFGGGVALSADGTTLAVGASTEASNATGINGNQADNSLLQAGAVYLY